ncbi:hypothetical protein [Candidatus Methylacidithermus pantelleriae]|nr:hypothetical protein [Candidatus Methylacidithermus pantelleriae]
MSSWDVTIGHTGEARSGGTGDAFQWKYAVDASSGTDFTLNSTVYTLFNCWGFPKFFNNSTSTLPGSINNPVASFPCIDNTTGATISGRVIKWVSVPAFPDEGVDLFVGATPGTGVTSFTVGGFLAYSEIY